MIKDTGNPPTHNVTDTESAILKHLLLGAPRVGYLVIDATGEKAVYPVPITPEEIPALIVEHRAGQLRPRQALTKEGHSFQVTNAVGLAAPTVVREPDGSSSCIDLAFDVDTGPGHVAGLSAEEARRVVAALATFCAENQLPPLICTSRSGVGVHVRVLLPQRIDARQGQRLAELICLEAAGGAEVETFPAQGALRADQPVGKWLALPFGGYADSPHGGKAIDAQFNPVPPVMATADAATVAALLAHCATIQKAEDEMAATHAAMATLHFANRQDNDPTDYADLGLQPVIDHHAEVCDDRVQERHIVRIRCPTHHGSCFCICPDQGWFYCFRCRHSGGGPGAPYRLLRLLHADWSTDQAHAELKPLRRLQAEATTAMTTMPAPASKVTP